MPVPFHVFQSKQESEIIDTFEFFTKMKQDMVGDEYHVFTGMSFLDTDLLALADFSTSTVHIFDINQKETLSSIRLQTIPHDICGISKTKMVTTHNKALSVIDLKKGTNEMSVAYKIDLGNKVARGIDKNESRLFVVCVGPDACIQMYSTALQLENEILLEGISCPLSIAVAGDKIYVTDSENHAVFGLTMAGERISKYEYYFDTEPISLAKDGDGNIYVTAAYDKNIHRITFDGNEERNCICLPEAETGLSAIAHQMQPCGIVCSDGSGKNIILHSTSPENRIMRLSNPRVYSYLLKQQQPNSIYGYFVDLIKKAVSVLNWLNPIQKLTNYVTVIFMVNMSMYFYEEVRFFMNFANLQRIPQERILYS